jgi:sugar O-acyltransferase (sialic acid O-acetyltransferase NeuD family)
MVRVLILGAGGHAQVVADILLRARDAGQRVDPIGYLDDDTALHGKVFLGLAVLGDTSALGRIPHDAVIIAIGDNQIRRRLAEELASAGAPFFVARHPTAVIAPDVEIGPGAMICANVVVNTGVVIGAHVILNTACTVDHHNRVGNYAHIAPGAHTGGEVVIEEGALVGIGATVAPRVSVGAWATVGAGAVVTRPVPPGVTVVGVPAKPLQKG